MRKYKNIKILIPLLILISISSLHKTYAETENINSDIERTNLAKLVQEIDFLSHRVDQIKNNAPIGQRLRFNYDALKNDLTLIRSGITNYINKSLKAGRSLTPISGQYRYRGKK